VVGLMGMIAIVDMTNIKINEGMNDQTKEQKFHVYSL
jgi:hypothetical protein